MKMCKRTKLIRARSNYGETSKFSGKVNRKNGGWTERTNPKLAGNTSMRRVSRVPVIIHHAIVDWSCTVLCTACFRHATILITGSFRLGFIEMAKHQFGCNVHKHFNRNIYYVVLSSTINFVNINFTNPRRYF